MLATATGPPAPRVLFQGTQLGTLSYIHPGAFQFFSSRGHFRNRLGWDVKVKALQEARHRTAHAQFYRDEDLCSWLLKTKHQSTDKRKAETCKFIVCEWSSRQMICFGVRPHASLPLLFRCRLFARLLFPNESSARCTAGLPEGCAWFYWPHTGLQLRHLPVGQLPWIDHHHSG
jgi:hypothetical protein